MAIADHIKRLTEEFKDTKPTEEEIIVVNRPGRKFEESFLGFTLKDDYNLFYKPEEYEPFAEALEEVSWTQPEDYNPASPSGGCNGKFFEAVKALISVDADQLRYFVSIGTKLDFFHSADAIFCWRDVTVTIDVTADPEKIQKFKQRQVMRQMGESLTRLEKEELAKIEKEVRADFCISPAEVESGDVYTIVAQQIVVALIRKFLQRYN